MARGPVLNIRFSSCSYRRWSICRCSAIRRVKLRPKRHQINHRDEAWVHNKRPKVAQARTVTATSSRPTASRRSPSTPDRSCQLRKIGQIAVGQPSVYPRVTATPNRKPKPFALRPQVNYWSSNDCLHSTTVAYEHPIIFHNYRPRCSLHSCSH